MRVKVRYSTGASPPVVLTLPDSLPVSSLLAQIQASGNLPTSNIEIRHSFPPKLLDLATLPPETPLASLPFKLDGDQLTVRSLDPPRSSVSSSSQPSPSQASKPKPKPKPATFSPTTTFPPNESDPPDALLPGRGTVVLRVMEDDNSCLFRALSYVLTNGLTSPTELRQIVTTWIQNDPETYSAAVLGQPVDEYCQWISMESSWGGGIELAILAKFFDIEILAIDVSTLSTMRFNDPRPRFCMLVYSGIHYDALALSPLTEYSLFLQNPDKDSCIFDRGDQGILQAAMELVRKLKQKKYFTDTKRFTLRCGVCGLGLVGEEAARAHARKTGHTEFGEF
ncbi:OTU-domain-containing protein [Terfezia boudieri ATCC MYA-4762]|uniref:Ubiquitin thioesterase OTU n=1 Tax=Terfezia boudieri ATCC MYA-4762 TaxID=1051890 RepID=A0A3N4LEX4_9PEZI|nr:OTU-domain-containing protein [Terfezia boudieri ATCC MYA-4762]